MDVDGKIVSAWMQKNGFLVQGKLGFYVKHDTHYAPSHVDMVCYRFSDDKKIAVDIPALMTETVSLSCFKKPENHNKLFKITTPEARRAVREYFDVKQDDQYESWLVISKLANKQRGEILEFCREQGVDRVIGLREILSDVVKDIRSNPALERKEESLQTIQALVLSDLL
jgi:hypothetical protein